MTNNDIHDQYAVIIHGDDGKNYTLHWNGGFNGTDTDEWSAYIRGVGQVMDRKRAFEVASDPNVGYGRAPQGRLVVYKLSLSPVQEEIIKKERAATVKEEALNKLTDEEKRALGLNK